VETLLASAQPAELWIADRNFCTRGILAGWQRRGSAFIVREHGAAIQAPAKGGLWGVSLRFGAALVIGPKSHTAAPAGGCRMALGYKNQHRPLTPLPQVQVDRPRPRNDARIFLKWPLSDGPCRNPWSQYTRSVGLRSAGRPTGL